MMTPDPSDTLTLQLEPDLYRAAHEAAKRRHLEMDELIRELLTAFVQSEEDTDLYDAFCQLGEDVEGCSVEYAVNAQREAQDRAYR